VNQGGNVLYLYRTVIVKALSSSTKPISQT
jgi:hypothetical protein